MSVITSSHHQRSSLTKSTPTDALSFGQEHSTSIELYYEDLGSGPPASYRFFNYQQSQGDTHALPTIGKHGHRCNVFVVVALR
jgi:hypothetical protein